jgi:hypothetical protein
MNLRNLLTVIFLIILSSCRIESVDTNDVNGYDVLKGYDIEVIVKCENDEDCASLLELNSCVTVACNLTIHLCLTEIDISKNGMECNDGNPCTAGDKCKSGICTGVSVSCNDNNPCTEDYCLEGAGCKNIKMKDGIECDDGNKCTQDDFCFEGTCKGGVNTCKCEKEEDCAKIDDNFCDGIFYCSENNECVNKPGTEIVCKQPKDIKCRISVCEKETGNCILKNAPDDTLCSDGNECTMGDKCKDGLCTGGEPVKCDDGNGCTADSCSSETGKCEFKNVDDQTICDDQNLCTSDSFCVSGVCKGFNEKKCNDTEDCTSDSCDKTTGECIYIKKPDSTLCSDLDICTEGETCSEGVCKNGNFIENCCYDPVMCEDNDPCTDNTCDMQSHKCVFNKIEPCG